jgi:RNA polymerase sigma factor (sigma-70 family)
MSRFSETEITPSLLARAVAGDSKAHEGLYLAFSGPVYTLARRMLGQPAQADEVLQDTFVEVLDGIGKFRGDAPLSAWIRKIAVSKCLMHLRSAWYRKGRSIEGIPGVVELVLQDQAGPSEADLTGVAMDLEQALSQLHPVGRAVVWLYDVEGYTHPEIAEMLGKTVSFSKSQLARSHQRLQAMLKPEQGGLTCMQASNNS